MSSMGCDTISIGSIIQYILRTSQQPVNPNRLWRGRVDMVIRNAYNDRQGMCYVRSIEPGYEGFGECVFFGQIVSIENN